MICDLIRDSSCCDHSWNKTHTFGSEKKTREMGQTGISICNMQVWPSPTSGQFFPVGCQFLTQIKKISRLDPQSLISEVSWTVFNWFGFQKKGKWKNNRIGNLNVKSSTTGNKKSKYIIENTEEISNNPEIIRVYCDGF